MNQISMTGRLTKDPELRYTPNNRPVSGFTIAVRRRFVKENDEVKADFFNIVVWGKQAENCKQYLVKGSQIGVTGELRTRNYDDKDGIKRYVTEVIANNVEFLGTKRLDNQSEEPIEQAPEETTPYDFQDVQQEQGSIYDNDFTINDDDLPF